MLFIGEKMIQIDSIKNAQLISSPWEHKIVDDFCSYDVFEKLSIAARSLEKFSEKENSFNVYPYQFENYGLGKGINRLMIDTANSLLNHTSDILKDFSSFSPSYSGYCCLPYFNVTGENFRYPIHRDSTNKSLTIILYSGPGPNKGTLLYTSKEEDSFSFEVPWKQNRAFIMCPEQDKGTWHTWENYEKHPRVVINFSAQRIEKMNEILSITRDDCNKDMFFWFLEQVNNGDLVSNNI